MTVTHHRMRRADKERLEPDIHRNSQEERQLEHLSAEVIKPGRHTSSPCSPDRTFSMREAKSGCLSSAEEKRGPSVSNFQADETVGAGGFGDEGPDGTGDAIV